MCIYIYIVVAKTKLELNRLKGQRESRVGYSVLPYSS